MKQTFKELGICVIGAIFIFMSINILYVSSLTRTCPLTEKKVFEVYHQLTIHSGQQDIPPLIILKSDVLNAWTDGKKVVITTELINSMHNEDELAMVLGHEMAHAINHDVYHDDLDQRDVEAHADKLGAFIMMRAGFDVCKGKEIFRVFMERYGDEAATSSHPGGAYRIDQLNLPQCQ